MQPAKSSTTRSILQSTMQSAMQSGVLRGLRLVGFGALITVANFFVFPLQPIYFGVLTLLGSAAVLTAVLNPALKRLNPCPGLLLSFVLFAITYGIGDGFFGFFGLPLVKLPNVLYQNLTTAYFGLPFIGFRSADYYPLFPWIFLFLTGFFLQEVLERKTLASTSCTTPHSDIDRAQCPNTDIVGVQRLNRDKKCPTLRILSVPAWIGRNALWIYLLTSPSFWQGFWRLERFVSILGRICNWKQISSFKVQLNKTDAILPMSKNTGACTLSNLQSPPRFRLGTSRRFCPTCG